MRSSSFSPQKLISYFFFANWCKSTFKLQALFAALQCFGKSLMRTVNLSSHLGLQQLHHHICGCNNCFLQQISTKICPIHEFSILYFQVNQHLIASVWTKDGGTDGKTEVVTNTQNMNLKTIRDRSLFEQLVPNNNYCPGFWTF